MKTLQEIKQTLSRILPDTKQRYKLRDMGIFGSYVKNTQTQQSDVDILVDFEEAPSLFEFVELKNELSDVLNMKVDVVMKSSLKPHIGQRIMQEVVLLWAKEMSGITFRIQEELPKLKKHYNGLKNETDYWVGWTAIFVIHLIL